MVLYSGPGFLSSATWPSLPKKHYNGLIWIWQVLDGRHLCGVFNSNRSQGHCIKESHPLSKPKLSKMGIPQWYIARHRAASHHTISVVRRIRLDAICHDGSSQVIVANDWHRDPCDAPSHTTRLIPHDCVQSHNLPRCLRYFWTCSKCYDGLRYPPIVRIAADRIATRRPVGDGVVGGHRRSS